jgi:hypothetical protein
MVESNIMARSRLFSKQYILNLDIFNAVHRIHCAGIFVYGFVLLTSEAIRCFVMLVTRVSKIIHMVLNLLRYRVLKFWQNLGV